MSKALFPVRSVVVRYAETEAPDDVLPRLVSLLSRGMARLLASEDDEPENDENGQEAVDFGTNVSVTTDGQEGPRKEQR